MCSSEPGSDRGDRQTESGTNAAKVHRGVAALPAAPAPGFARVNGRRIRRNYRGLCRISPMTPPVELGLCTGGVAGGCHSGSVLSAVQVDPLQSALRRHGGTAHFGMPVAFFVTRAPGAALAAGTSRRPFCLPLRCSCVPAPDGGLKRKQIDPKQARGIARSTATVHLFGAPARPAAAASCDGGRYSAAARPAGRSSRPRLLGAEGISSCFPAPAPSLLASPAALLRSHAPSLPCSHGSPTRRLRHADGTGTARSDVHRGAGRGIRGAPRRAVSRWWRGTLAGPLWRPDAARTAGRADGNVPGAGCSHGGECPGQDHHVRWG
jgi:hypothetical protein